MDLDNTEKALEAFRKYVRQQARSRLSKAKPSAKKVTGELYDRLEGKLDVGPNWFSLSWDLGYGVFQDQGVKGANPSNVSKNAKIRGQQAPNSPYRFGSGKFSGTWDKFVRNLVPWVKSKRLRLRDDQGRFVRGNYKSVAYVVARNIYSRGIRPSLFFTKPFEDGFKRLPDELAEAFGLDVEGFLQFTINQDLKNK